MDNLLQKKARELGADDARWGKTSEGASVLLIFCAYGLPPVPPYKGEIQVSNYYLASQRGYTVSTQLEKYAAELRISAHIRTEHDSKQIAAGICGGIGKNTLFFHPEFGSLTSVHVLETSLEVPVTANTSKDFCGKCDLCAKICPTNAITAKGFARENCVRNYLTLPDIPHKFARHVYQLSGCEQCQVICPKRPERVQQPHTFDLIEVIEGKRTAEIKKLIGANYGRRRIIVNQAMIYAANTSYLEAIPAVSALLDDPYCGQTAVYSLERLQQEV